MSSKEQSKVAMLDTSFLIRFLKKDEPLHASAQAYLRFLMENKFVLYVSTVAVAEYCVHGSIDEIPFEYVRIVPFNLDHAEIAGSYASVLYQAKNKGQYSPEQRIVIPNDTKLFAQASSIGALYFVTADSRASKAISILAQERNFSVAHVDIHEPISTFSGTLF